MKKTFKYYGISNKVWDKFVDSGEIKNEFIKIISFKIIKGFKLTEREMAILCSKTSEINEIIRNYE